MPLLDLFEVDGEVRIYYGAADSCIGLATPRVADLVDGLRQTSGRMRRDDIG